VQKLVRKKPMRRSTKPMKKRNPKRRKNEFARTYHSRERVAWVKEQPCAVNGAVACGIIFNRYPTENAHIKGGGGGRKSDARFIVPLCSAHHRWLHIHGKAKFEADYHVDLDEAAAETERRWQQCVGDWQ